MATETKHTFCRICEASCGLELTLEDGHITDIKPNAEHVGTEGFACMKGLNQHHMYASPDRLQTPLKRVGDDFVPISWKQANREIGAKVKKLKQRSPHTIGMYVGTAAGFSILHPIFANGFLKGIGSRNIYSSATQDCANRFASAQEMYGFPFLQPFPDLDKINYLLIAGTNPIVSKWTFLQVTHPAKRLKEITKRGGKVAVIDPRRTETAKLASEHVFIQPNADAFFFASFLDEVIKQGGVKDDIVAEHMTGFEAVRDLVTDWPATRTEAVTGISPETLKSMVADYLAADGAGIVTGTGLGMGRYGTTAHWLAECINAVTGNLDRDGGMLIGEGIFDFAAFSQKSGEFDRTVESRIGGFKQLNGGLPGAILADEILTPGDEQLRALFVTGGNPLLTMANSERLSDAFKELELLVVTDIYMNETASLAHYILPATSPLERADLPFVFPLFLGLQSKPYLSATDQVVPRTGQQRDEATIYTDLAKASGVGLFGSRVGQVILNRMTDLNSLLSRKAERSLPIKFILNQILIRAGQPGFKELVKTPDGIARPQAVGGTYLSKKVTTESGKIQLSTPMLLSEAAGMPLAFEQLKISATSFRLITKRHHFTHNSWTQNIRELTEGPARETNHAWLNPEDAKRLGIEEGDAVDIQSATGKIRLPTKFLSDLAPGVVAVPHGWGHQRAKGLSVASKIAGANVNILAADGPDDIEKISGMAHLTGIEVHVAKANAEISRDSWTGL
ncbi:MAG: molybdopterin-dependent oxidoreductase [Pseudomonadota bacterium]